jgi:HK97 family phage major capsid protein
MSKLQELNAHIESVVERKAEAVKAEIESAVEQKLARVGSPAVHTQRASEWDNYEVGKGKAFRAGLEAMYRAWTNEGSTTNAAKYAKDPVFAERFLGVGTDGGQNVIPQILARDIIPALYARLDLIAAGATVMPMEHNKLPIGRQNGKATAEHFGEGAALTGLAGPTFNQIVLDAKKLVARADIANDFLRANPYVALDYIAQDLVKAVAEKMNQHALEGIGSATAPTGIFSQIAAANKEDFSVGGGVATMGPAFEARLDLLENNLLANNVSPGSYKFLMSDRDFLFLRRQRATGGTGILLFEDLRLAQPMFNGVPVVRTNQIAGNRDDSGAGDNDESRIYLGDWSSVLLGIMTNMELAFSTENRFDSDETVVRLVTHYDVQLKRDTDLTVLSTDISFA